MAEINTSSPGPRHYAPERLGDQIDAFGGVAREDDFAHGGCVDEALHRGAGVLERLGGALAEQVDAAVDVRIVLAVVGHQRVQHRTSFCVVAALSR